MFGFPSHRGMFGDPWSSNVYQQRAPTQWDAHQPSWFMEQDPWQQRPRGCHTTQADLEQQLLKQRLVRQQQAREQQAREQQAREQLARQQHAAAARMRQVPEPLVPPQSHQQQAPAPMHKQRQEAPFPQRSSSCSSLDSFYSTSSAADSDDECYSEAMECCSPPPQPANKQQQQQQHHQQAGAGSSPKLSPAAAAVAIQAAWRMSRLARQRPALKQLAAAAAQLRGVSAQLEATRQEAAAAGVGLTQKQYLELSEPVMKVLFALDAISCGPAVELRMVRKRLSSAANALLDRIQAVYNAPPPTAAAPQQPHQQPPSVAAPATQPAAAQQRTKRHKSRKLRRLSFD